MKLSAKTEKEMREYNVPTPQSQEELIEFVQSCIDAVGNAEEMEGEELGDAYGRCVYAMSLASVATFNYMASYLGVTGFQAACADMDILKRTRNMNGPFSIVDYSKMLYPQSADVVGSVEQYSKDAGVVQWLKEEAQKNLDEHEPDSVHPDVYKHWQKLAA